MLTSRAVFMEIGNALSKLRYRAAAVEILNALEADPNIEIIPLSEALYHRAFELFLNRSDKEWGLTDCLSYILMQERGLTEALTADDHFRQAGFTVLLRQE